MRKVLILADSPTCITGFGKVSRHIAKTLHETGEYDITVVGINYDGFPPHDFPYTIAPATSALVEKYADVYGRRRTLDFLATGTFDIFFCIQDMGVTATFMGEVKKIQEKLPAAKKFVSILYTPVDSKLSTQPKWIADGCATFDFPVTYTEFGKREILTVMPVRNLDICGHGADVTEFYPLPKAVVDDFKKSAVHSLDLSNKFVVLNVNRNQIRKDYTHCFKAFAELKREVPCAFLFVLAQIQDQGGNLVDMARQCGLVYGVDWYAPNDYSAAHGYSVEVINMIYNIADVVFSSTVGEGWGLSSTEAMAVGKPVVFPDNTSLREILGNGERGYLIPSGDSPDRWISYGAYDSSLVRPTIDTVSAAKALKRIFDHPEEAAKKVEAAKNWVMTNTWDAVNKFWVKKFDEAWVEVGKRREAVEEKPHE